MELSNEKASIVDLLRAAEKGLETIGEANDVKARVLLDWIEKGTYWISMETGKRLYIPSGLLDMLHKIHDKNFRKRSRILSNKPKKRRSDIHASILAGEDWFDEIKIPLQLLQTFSILPALKAGSSE